jgi:hypothetical protein
VKGLFKKLEKGCLGSILRKNKVLIRSFPNISQTNENLKNPKSS